MSRKKEYAQRRVADLNVEDHDFEVGLNVWAKMQDCRPWPSKIMRKRRSKLSHIGKVCVLFYGDEEEFAWINIENIVELTPHNLLEFSRDCNHDEGFVPAVQQAYMVFTQNCPHDGCIRCFFDRGDLVGHINKHHPDESFCEDEFRLAAIKWRAQVEEQVKLAMTTTRAPVLGHQIPSLDSDSAKILMRMTGDARPVSECFDGNDTPRVQSKNDDEAMESGSEQADHIEGSGDVERKTELDPMDTSDEGTKADQSANSKPQPENGAVDSDKKDTTPGKSEVKDISPAHAEKESTESKTSTNTSRKKKREESPTSPWCHMACGEVFDTHAALHKHLMSAHMGAVLSNKAQRKRKRLAEPVKEAEGTNLEHTSQADIDINQEQLSPESGDEPNANKPKTELNHDFISDTLTPRFYSEQYLKSLEESNQPLPPGVRLDRMKEPSFCVRGVVVGTHRNQAEVENKAYVRIGEEFQATSLPSTSSRVNKGQHPKSGRKVGSKVGTEPMVWAPHPALETIPALKTFLEFARVRGRPATGEKWKQRDMEYAHHVLHRHLSDRGHRKRPIMTQVMLDFTDPKRGLPHPGLKGYHYDGSTAWSQSDIDLFKKGYKEYGKQFRAIKTNFLPGKTMPQLVEFYYGYLKRDPEYQQLKQLVQDRQKEELERALQEGFVSACDHCGATVTPRWRVAPIGEQDWCDECYTYYNLHKKKRPFDKLKPTKAPKQAAKSRRPSLQLKKAKTLHTCPTCKKTFQVKNSLYGHMRIHNEPIQAKPAKGKSHGKANKESAKPQKSKARGIPAARMPAIHEETEESKAEASTTATTTAAAASATAASASATATAATATITRENNNRAVKSHSNGAGMTNGNEFPSVVQPTTNKAAQHDQPKLSNGNHPGGEETMPAGAGNGVSES